MGNNGRKMGRLDIIGEEVKRRDAIFPNVYAVVDVDI